MEHTQRLRNAEHHLRQYDPILAPVITAAGPCMLAPHRNYYQELVESIIGQQLSLKAAASILARFRTLYDGGFPSPELILNTTPEQLRSVGLSNAKVRYIQSLAEHVTAGQLDFDSLDTMDDQTVIHELTKVNGIGEWTAHMFLMFCMGRLDVLPVGDLGIKSGIRKLYGLDHLPAPAEVQTVATSHNWAPYRSVASWYVWKALDNDWNMVKESHR